MEKLNFKHIAERPKNAPRTGANSERATILQEFLEILNSERKPPYKPLTPARLGMMLAALDTRELYVFLAELKQSKHFSKSFWWRMNPKNYA